MTCRVYWRVSKRHFETVTLRISIINKAIVAILIMSHDAWHSAKIGLLLKLLMNIIMQKNNKKQTNRNTKILLGLSHDRI